jgi:IS30 family transposase
MLLGDKQIIDGRNRYLACKIAGVKPQFTPVSLTERYDAYDYVVSQNIRRRQLTTEKRREVVKKLREQGKSIRDIALTMNATKSTVADDVGHLSDAGQLNEPEQIEGLDKKKRSTTKKSKGTVAKKKNYSNMADGIADKINNWLRPDQSMTKLIEELIEHRPEISEVSWLNLISVIGLEAKRARELGERMYDAGDIEELMECR